MNHTCSRIAAVVMASGLSFSVANADEAAPKYQRAAPELIKPAPPDDGTRPSCVVPRKYIDLLRGQRYSEIGALYAEDAIHYAPDGKTYRGRKAISDFYMNLKNTSAKDSPVYGVSYIQDGRECVVEIAGTTDISKRPIAVGAIDHFTVDEKGLIKIFTMYISPPATVPPNYMPRDHKAPPASE